MKEIAQKCSIEVTPTILAKKPELLDLLQEYMQGQDCFVTDLPGKDPQETIDCCKNLANLGVLPVAHIGARAVKSEQSLKDRLHALREHAQCEALLLLGGSDEKPQGPFDRSDLLIPYVQELGFKRIFFAAHPETPDYMSEDDIKNALTIKHEIAESLRNKNIECELVTQFCFSSDTILNWEENYRANGFTLPINLGLSGPATIKTLLHYATICGVGASARFLKSKSDKLGGLLNKHGPTSLAKDIIEKSSQDSVIAGFHIFPLGGVASSLEWRQEWLNS